MKPTKDQSPEEYAKKCDDLSRRVPISPCLVERSWRDGFVSGIGIGLLAGGCLGSLLMVVIGRFQALIGDVK